MFPKYSYTQAELIFLLWNMDQQSIQIKYHSKHINFLVMLISSGIYIIRVFKGPMSTILGRYMSIGATFGFFSEKLICEFFLIVNYAYT